MKIISNGFITHGTVKVLLACFLLSGLAAAGVEFQEPVVLESPNAQVNGYFGAEGVNWVPDVNGDGVIDIVIGALGEGPPGSPAGAGRAYVFDGATRVVLTELKSPNEVAGGGFGWRVAGIEDLNGNGSGDVIVSTGEGSVADTYVVDGANGEVIHTMPGTRGRSLSAVPDVNGDGLPEILVGSDGSAALYDGKTGDRLRAFVPNLMARTQLYGWASSGVADVNGDGAGDVLVSDWYAYSVQGRAYIFDGATGALLHALTPPPGGATEFGRSVAGLEDINGDGRGDLIVGASMGASKYDGRAYVFDGTTGQLLSTIGSPANTKFFGWIVAALPDVTGDHLNDVLVGNFGNAPLKNAYLYDGTTGAHLVTLPGNNDFGGGGSIVGIPDVNGDGLGEVLVADYSATSSGGFTKAGHVLLYLSKAPPMPPSLQFMGLDAESFTIMVNAPSNSVVDIQATSDFQTWDAVTNFVPDGNPVELNDPGASNQTQRFYRAVQE